LERIEKPKNFRIVYLIVNKILRIVIPDYGTNPEKHGAPNSLLYVKNIRDWENVNENS